MQKFCYWQDKKLQGKSVFDYYDLVETISTEKITTLLLADFVYRFQHQLNVLIEIYGQQGSGKSLFGQALAFRLAQIFKQPFIMEQNTVADFDILDNTLHNTPFRSTFVVDEQPNAMYGYGSSRVMRSLKDYEEICRYTMKNIIYIAPSEREHSSYYVFKEDSLPSVERHRNPKCFDCPQQEDCLKIFAENKYKTLCGIPFWERHGYPVAFRFMLIMSRKTDNMLMPRGYVRLPVLPPKLMIEYDVIKNRNIKLFEDKISFGWQELRAKLKLFQNEYQDKLFNDNGKIIPKDMIKALILDYFGARSLTTAEIDMLCAIVKYEVKAPDFAEVATEEIKKLED